ncbi:MAG: hypothetical protein AAB375_00190 [Patescibacteria group bacterium]
MVDAWSSETLGWVVRFPRPEGIDLLPVGRGPGTKGELLKQHSQKCFQRLDKMLGDGISVVARVPILRVAVLIGPEDACLRLKKKLEDERFAVMSKDAPFELIW